MAVIFNLGLFLLSVFSSLLVEYRFSKNFGQIFYDFSGSANHGQNGESVDSSLKDTSPSDRGAYFPSSNSFIQLPPNNVKPTGISIGSIFSIVMWVCPLEVSNDLYLTFRIKDCSNYFSFSRVALSNSFRGEIKKSTEYKILSSQKRNIIPIKTWTLASMINNGATATYASNGNAVLTVSQSTTYSESGTFFHYIGYPESSFIGFLWSFYLYNEIVSLSNFFASSGTTCLVPPCTASCSPAIKENTANFCISTSDPSPCSQCNYGCSNGICLDCTPCNSRSCQVNGGSVKCICPDSLLYPACLCPTAQYFNGSNFMCKNCYDECSSCKEGNLCLGCIKTNAEPNSVKGCQCKVGYFNVTALNNNGSCLICLPECLSCLNGVSCTSCKAENSEIDSNGKCACKNGYYQAKSLSNIDACLKCPDNCSTCSSPNNCLICLDINQFPENGACRCKNNYYIKDTSLFPPVCEICPNTCFECKNSIHCQYCNFTTAFFNTEETCKCNSGFYDSQSKSCLNCTKDCFGCDSPSNCSQCNYQNSYLLDYSCYCKKGYWKSSNLEGFFCLECNNTDSGKSLDPNCMCDDGFFLGNNLTCTKCNKDCFECESSSYCTLCQYQNSYIKENSCFCNKGYWKKMTSEGDTCFPCNDTTSGLSLDKNCRCNDGFFMENDLTCSKCKQDCFECISPSSYCNLCNYTNSFIQENTCFCKQGYWRKSTSQGDTCFPCNDTTSGLSLDKNCMCDAGFFMENDLTCSKCKQDCFECISPSSYCNLCEYKNSFIQENTCFCKQGYWKKSTPEGDTCFPCNDTSSGLSLDPNCKCNDGFFMQNDLTCSKCKQDCFECISPSSYCNLCEYKNSFIQENTCFCKQGYWKKSTPEGDTCFPCNDTTSGLSLDKNCMCNDGFFMQNNLTCSKCKQDCFECISPSSYCNLCEYKNSFIQENTCFCKQGYWKKSSTKGDTCFPCNDTTSGLSLDKNCMCEAGFFMEKNLTCSKCKQDCFECISPSSYCNLCNYKNSFIQENTCFCKKGYWKKSTPEGDICFPCNDTTSGLSLDPNCICDTGFYLEKNLTCSLCKQDCFECESLSYCSLCEYQNSHLNKSLCSCNEGFILDQNCKLNVFYANLTISTDFTATLWFDQKLKDPLDSNQVLVSLDKKNISFQLKTLQMDRFEITFDLDLLTKTVVLNVIFTQEIYSEISAVLQNKYLNKTIIVSGQLSNLIELKKEAKQSEKMADSGSTAGVSAAVGISLLNVDPNSFFDFLSTAEIFYSVYLFNLEFNPILESFLLGTRIQKKSIKVLTRFLTPNDGATLDKKHRLFGYETNLFLINTEPFLQTLALISVIFILLLIIRKVKILEAKIVKICSFFKYSIFLRFWMQSFLEFLVCLKLEYSNNSLGNALQIIDLCICIIISVIFKQIIELFLVFFLLKLIFDRAHLVNKLEIDEFNKFYGIFFIEFKDEHYRYWLFYVFYIFRRLVIIAFIVFGTDGGTQIIFTAAFSLIVIFI